MVYLSEQNSKQLLIGGDFNYPRIDWINCFVETGATNTVHRAESNFLDSCQDCFLYQNVFEFTRKRGQNEPSLLDLIFTKNELEIETIIYDTPLA